MNNKDLDVVKLSRLKKIIDLLERNNKDKEDFDVAFEYIIAKFKAYEEKSGRIDQIISNKSEHIVENEVKQVDELIAKLQKQEDDMPD